MFLDESILNEWGLIKEFHGLQECWESNGVTVARDGSGRTVVLDKTENELITDLFYKKGVKTLISLKNPIGKLIKFDLIAELAPTRWAVVIPINAQEGTLESITGMGEARNLLVNGRYTNTDQGRVIIHKREFYNNVDESGNLILLEKGINPFDSILNFLKIITTSEAVHAKMNFMESFKMKSALSKIFDCKIGESPLEWYTSLMEILNPDNVDEILGIFKEQLDIKLREQLKVGTLNFM